MIEVKEFNIPGLKMFSPKVFRDDRGFFIERYNQQALEKVGFKQNFVQDNFSRSEARVLRGLHFQYDEPQAKLVSCARGRIFDVAVDLRHTEQTFGKYVAVELSGDTGDSFWIPAGFAHGFCVLGDEPADVFYKVSCAYNPKSELSLVWNDASFKIDWPYSQPKLSHKDQIAPLLESYLQSDLGKRVWWK